MVIFWFGKFDKIVWEILVLLLLDLFVILIIIGFLCICYFKLNLFFIYCIINLFFLKFKFYWKCFKNKKYVIIIMIIYKIIRGFLW